MSGQAGEPVVLGHEIKRRMEPIQDTPAPTSSPRTPLSCPALLLPVQPQCQGLQGRSLAIASIPQNHIHGPCQHPLQLGTAGDRHQRAKGRDSSPASACLLPTPEQTNATDTPSRHPHGSKALLKTRKTFLPAAAAIPGVSVPAASAQCHQLLSRSGVDGDSVVQVGLGGPHLDGHSKALQHFVAAQPLHVQSHHLWRREKPGGTQNPG